MEKASQDSAFLMNLVAKERTVNNTINNAVNNNVNNTVNKNNNIEPEVELEDANETADKNNADKLKTFVWPDKAVYLLIEIYREKEEEFTNGFKRSNKIWAEIAAQMNEANPAYELTAQQCTSKMSGLKRTYKNIVDQNKKSGNSRNSLWIHYLPTKRRFRLLQLPRK
ncbi:uncharacterized protein LOC115234762 isoform X2 [Formica exsecta]|uniref:uncharacterized protein LOC115234762 isoform X2 n=1 Tax=Formica exsecta TaxID=72781 RepID=UPI0011412889|nr:uncharacterized protein LOC115234762 isoform X2 [Formica exsecta]